VHTLTGGASVKSNINLIKRNAAVGAQLAVELKNKENRAINHSQGGSFPMFTPKA